MAAMARAISAAVLCLAVACGKGESESAQEPVAAAAPAPIDGRIDPAPYRAQIEATDGRLPPFTIHGTQLRSIHYELPVASAQVKSCVLLAGLAADGATTVSEPTASRDHTERMLAAAGVTVHRNGRHVTVAGTDELTLAQAVALLGQHHDRTTLWRLVGQ